MADTSSNGMFGWGGIISLTILALAAFAHPAHAQPATLLAPGTNYATVREALQAQGYEPLVFPRGGPWDPCTYESICRAYPEIIDCSGMGFNPCRFAFRAPEGGYLVGVTAGESPDAMSLDALARANAQDTRAIENLLAGRAMFADEATSEPPPVENSQIAVAPEPSSQPYFEGSATTTQSDQTLNTILFLALIVAALAIYLIPTFIAFSRGHRYKFPIMAFNIGAGWSGIGWIWTLVWSLWPQNTALVDPLIGDATGIERRQ
ncbi:MAG: superinfection immunity protein [Hyphomonadaceae bacterium]|nr:superinfection immunity protein [Hyphomonadaceae bacterium]